MQSVNKSEEISRKALRKILSLFKILITKYLKLFKDMHTPIYTSVIRRRGPYVWI